MSLADDPTASVLVLRLPLNKKEDLEEKLAELRIPDYQSFAEACARMLTHGHPGFTALVTEACHVPMTPDPDTIGWIEPGKDDDI